MKRTDNSGTVGDTYTADEVQDLIDEEGVTPDPEETAAELDAQLAAVPDLNTTTKDGRQELVRDGVLHLAPDAPATSRTLTGTIPHVRIPHRLGSYPATVSVTYSTHVTYSTLGATAIPLEAFVEHISQRYGYEKVTPGVIAHEIALEVHGLTQNPVAVQVEIDAAAASESAWIRYPEES